MKAAAVLSLCLAAVASAKAVHNVYPVPRNENKDAAAQEQQKGENKGESRGNNKANNNNNNNNNNNGLNSLIQDELALILLWKFAGGSGATTQTINQQVTVTQTVTANAGAGNAGGAAQATATPAAAAPAAAAPAAAVGKGQDHVVTVGGPGGLAFSPSEVIAAVGDTVTFVFGSTNHSVEQSAFATPCVPLAGGLNSGFNPNPNNSVNPAPKIQMQVMSSAPLWFFCGQKGHCGKGMTFSVNPTAEKTQAIFQQMAIAQNGTGTGGAITGNGGGAAAPPAAGSSSAAPAATDISATIGAPAATPTDAGGAAQATGGVQTGTGQLQNGACVCAVQCASGSFPAAAQGVGAFGGIPGAIPLSMAVTS